MLDNLKAEESKLALMLNAFEESGITGAPEEVDAEVVKKIDVTKLKEAGRGLSYFGVSAPTRSIAIEFVLHIASVRELVCDAVIKSFAEDKSEAHAAWETMQFTLQQNSDKFGINMAVLSGENEKEGEDPRDLADIKPMELMVPGGILDPEIGIFSEKLTEFAFREIILFNQVASLRSVVSEMKEKLLQATINIDVEWLRYYLWQAKKLRMDRYGDKSVREVYANAQAMWDKIEEANTKMNEALACVDITVIDHALSLAEEVRLKTPLVTQVNQLKEKVKKYAHRAKQAAKGTEKSAMLSALKACEELGLKNEDTEKMEMLVALPEEKFLTSILKIAVEEGDEYKHTIITIAIKAMVFRSSGDLFQFHRFPRLKSTDEYSREASIFWRNHHSKHMTTWSAEQIPTSLTMLSESTEQVAVGLFRNVLGFMGDKPYTYTTMLAQELVRVCLEHVPTGDSNPRLKRASVSREDDCLNDEIFCQIMKQLTNNPGKDSVDKGWKLMRICLSVMGPSETLSNYLEYFLRENQKMDLVKKLHSLRIAQEKKRLEKDRVSAQLPSLSEIHELATDGKEHVDVTSGFLTIRKGESSMFARKRYFILEGEFLRFFKGSEGTSAEVGNVPVGSMTNVTNLQNNAAGKIFPFRLTATVKGADHDYELEAETFLEKQKWLEAIDHARQEYWDEQMDGL